MVLHMLYGHHQLADCLSLLTDKDALVVMHADLVKPLRESLGEIPCPLLVLEDAESDFPVDDGIVSISTADWVELICRHSHNISWS